MNEAIVEYVNTIDKLVSVNEFLKEDNVHEALNSLVKLAVKPDVPDATVRLLIVKLQAIGGTFAIRATYYATLDRGRAGTDESNKKNIYYTLSDVMDKIVAALKYLAKGNYGV